jgi:hypothetical protein
MAAAVFGIDALTVSVEVDVAGIAGRHDGRAA